MTLLLAVTGGLGSGKSEVVKIIRNAGGRVGCLKISEPLYHIQKMVQEYLELPLHKDRKLLQFLGTEWGRKNNPDFWINIFMDNLEKYIPIYDIIVCDDLRFKNEFLALKERGFQIAKIERPARARIQYEGTGDFLHTSEIDLLSISRDSFDFWIENNGTYDDFTYIINEMYLEMKESK